MGVLLGDEQIDTLEEAPNALALPAADIEAAVHHLQELDAAGAGRSETINDLIEQLVTMTEHMSRQIDGNNSLRDDLETAEGRAGSPRLAGDPYTLQLDFGGAGLLMASGVLCGFLFYFLTDVVYAFGLAGSLPPSLAAWTPVGICVLLALAMLFHLEDG